MMAEPMKTLELCYPVIQFLIISFLSLGLAKFPFPRETICSQTKSFQNPSLSVYNLFNTYILQRELSSCCPAIVEVFGHTNK